MQADWVLLAFAVIAFEIPRYTLSLVALVVMSVLKVRRVAQPAGVTVSVILPAFNGGAGLRRSVLSLRQQTLAPLEIIVVDDGSTDDTRATAEELRASGAVDCVIHHGTRCGRSPAVNAGARFARGDLILAADPDTEFAPAVLARMAAAFADPKVAAASCNLGVANEAATLWTAFQGIEYRMSISAGRSFLDIIRAISCCSGACSMYRRSVFLDRGGLDVGSGEDLEFTLRLRRFGHRVRFVPDAWADTAVPESAVGLTRQRLRWDRDALRIRLIQFREARFFQPFERLPDTLQRLDFIVFDLAPTLSLPFYLVYCVVLLGADALTFLSAVYVLLLGIALVNIGLTYLLVARPAPLFSVLAAPFFPLYQGILMKLVRFVAFTSEILFSASNTDDYVPPRVRRALLGQRP